MHNFIYPLISFIISAVVCFLIIKAGQKFTKFYDTLNKSHAVHKSPVPRVGGIALLTALILTGFFLKNQFIHKIIFFITLASIVGLIEDLKKDISPKIRLLTLIIISTLAVVIFEIKINNIGFAELPDFFGIPLTIIAIAGFTNAMNIIDGLNGLASGIALTFLLFLGLTFHEAGSQYFSTLCFIIAGATTGFLIFNFPKGKIFLGDSGSYFLGFSCAILSLELIKVHPHISPWFPLILGIFPVWEVLFSAYRRKRKNAHPFQPDKLHLHTLLYYRVTRSNPKASFLIVLGNFLFSSVAYIFRTCSVCLIFELLLFIFIYTGIYRRIVCFQYQQLKF